LSEQSNFDAISPPPKNVEHVILEYVDHKKGKFFKLTTCLSLNSLNHHHTLQILYLDKLNMSKSSGLVVIFTLVLPLVLWWCCCCCLFLWQWMMVSSTTVVAVEIVAARLQQQRRQWLRWTTIGGKSSWQRDRQRLHDGMQFQKWTVDNITTTNQ
jgi:hypothetical protein